MLVLNFSFGQINYGKITYERKTNLYKRFKSDSDVKEWLKEEDKNKIDIFELYFNDTASVFKPQESNLVERMSWATNKNVVYQNFKTNTRFTEKKIWGEQFYLIDSGIQRALLDELSIAVRPKTYQFGCAFEQFVINELVREISYGRRDYRLSYLQTGAGLEIDLVVERPWMPLLPAGTQRCFMIMPGLMHLYMNIIKTRSLKPGQGLKKG